MREKLKKIKDYIFRSWEDEGVDPRTKSLPPFFYDLIGFTIIASIIFSIFAYFLN
jgi:hypothetical protein